MRLASLPFALLLVAAPSGAAVQAGQGIAEMPVLYPVDSHLEPNFERAFVMDLADGTSAVAEMTRHQEWHGSKVGIVEALGFEWEAKEWPDGSRSIRFLDPNDFSCEVRYPAEKVPQLLPETNLNPEAVLGPTTIDVLIMYEPSAAVDAGGVDMLYASVLLAMDMVNEIPVNSGIPQLSLRLVGVEALTHEVPVSGYWPSDDVEVRLARESYHADLVSVVLSDTDGYAGIANMYCNGDPNCAYSMLHWTSLSAGIGGHEWGHNLGLAHDPAHASENPDLPEFNKSMSICRSQGNPNNVSGRMSIGAPPECGGYAVPINKIPGDGVYEQGVEFWNHDARQVQVVEMFAASVANYYQGPSGPCVPGLYTLCLDSEDGVGDKRFKVELGFETVQGGGLEGFAEVQPFSDSTVSGTLSFFDASNKEVLIKILNGCGINNRFWVFFAATTNVGFTMTITDTQVGTAKVYTNADGTIAVPVQDVDALPCN